MYAAHQLTNSDIEHMAIRWHECKFFSSSSFVSNYNQSFEQVVAVGWGRLVEGGSLPETLQQVTLQIIDDQAYSCSRVIHNTQVQICAGVSDYTKG
jgi:hypothetical protein